jgi:hypothetical protein
MNKNLAKCIEGYTHKHYDYTCQLAHFYSQIVTGEGYGELIVNYKPRETDQQKIQRVEITQNRTKSIAGKIEGFFKRVFRADKLAFDISHQDEQESLKIGQFTANYGDDGQNLLHWCEESALYYNNIDPNAFYWVQHERINEVDTFNPFVFSAHEVLDYKIYKGAVVKCCTKLIDVVSYQKEGTTYHKNICVYYYFNSEGLEMAIEIDAEVQQYSDFYDQFTDEDGFFFGELETVNEKTFIVTFTASEIDTLPITRVGYLHDKKTEKSTYVSFWDSATEEYKQLVNRGSEYDLSLTLHAFLQKVQYYTPCDYQDESHSICQGGILHPSGHTCPSCSGSGKKVHTSSQDVIEVQLPSEDGENISISPKDFVFYVDVPFDIVKQQKEDVSQYTPKITEAVFGVDISHQQGAMATATQIQNYYDTAQDAMFEFTKSPQRLFTFTVDIMAQSLEVQDLETKLLYTNEYDLESEEYLMQLLKLAKEAGASPEVIENINKRIVVKQNRTDSSYMTIYNIMRKFEPFSNITPDLKANIVLQLPDSSPQKALLLNFKEITEDIVANEPAFLLLDYNQQKDIIKAKAQAFAEMATVQNSVREIRGFNITDFDETDEPETE